MAPETAGNSGAEIRARALAARSVWLRRFGILTGGALVLAAYPLIAAAPQARYSALIGWAISLLMCLPSGWLAFGSLGGSMNRFMIVTFGSMIIRMAIVVGSLVLAVASQRAHIPAFLVALMGAYVLYQVLEIVMLKLNIPTSSGASV